MNLEKVFNFIKEKKGYDVPALYKLLNDIPLSDNEKTECINKLDSGEIYNLLNNSKEPDKITNILLSTEGFINKLNSNRIYNLLIFSTEPEKIINLLGNKGIEYINNLNTTKINILLKDSNEPDKIMNILGNKGIELINNLDSNGINILLRYSKEKEKIKELIRKRRPDIQLNESKLKL